MTVQVSLIEYTLRHTTLGALREGIGVHVEADVIGKYVQRLVGVLPDADADMTFGTVDQAIADIKAGKLVIVADDEDRENEGDLDLRRAARDARDGSTS